MKCLHCQHDNLADVKFWASVARGSNRYALFGAANPPGNKFCGECGVSFASARFDKIRIT